ncbi:MAG: flagellar basal body-associated FliL family protein [Gallionellaceae bacterium]
MKKSLDFILHKLLPLLMLSSFLLMTNAQAQSSGGDAGGGAYVKMEPYTVNLVGLMQVVQVAATLKMAKPEAGVKAKLYMPAIRHEVIILMSGKTAAQIESSAGKQQLINEIRVIVNKVIGLDAKEGVADVLLEQIIIQ